MSRYFILILLLNCYALSAQVRGFIYDADNGEPLTGATVVSNNRHYTVSDSAGVFYINDDSLLTEIKITHLGYESAVITNTGSKGVLDIGLEASPENISEVVISSSEFRQKLHALSSPVSVITRQEIIIENDLTVSSALNKQPGVFMQSGAINTNRLTIRGIGSRTPYSTSRVKVYFENIPITTGEGVTTIEDLDPESMGRIEIIRGPASGIYGAGLGGAIHIYADRHPVNKFDLTLNSSLGSYGMVKSSAKIGLHSGKVSLYGGYHYLQSDGYRENNKVERHSFHILNQYSLKKSILRLFIYYINLLAYIPSSIDEVSFNENPSMAARNWAAIRGFEKYDKLHSGITLTQRFGSQTINHTTFYTSLFDQYESRPFNILDDQSVSFGLRSRVTISRAIHDFSFGTEIYSESYRWKIFETNNGEQGVMMSSNQENRYYYNVFLHYKNELFRNTVIVADLNLNKLYYGLSSGEVADSTIISGQHGFKPVVSPRFGISYNLRLPLTVFASLNHGFSAPSFEETLNAEGQLNTQIKPESGWNVESGFRGNLIKTRMRYEISFYSMFVKNLLITKRIDEDIFTAVNAGATSHRGVEFSASYRLMERNNPEAANLTLAVNSTLSWNRFREFFDNDIDLSGNYLPGIPSSAVNAGLYRHSAKGLNFAVTFQQVGSMYLDDGNSGKTESYNLLNAKIIYKWSIAPKLKATFYFGIRNILNSRYASMILVNARGFNNLPPRYYYPGMPVNLKGGLQLRFGYEGK